MPTACEPDGMVRGDPRGAEAGKAVEPPAALQGLRFGALFVQRCWFSSYLQADRSRFATVATSAQQREDAARIVVAGRYLDITGAVASDDTAAVRQAAAAVAAAERALLLEEFSSLLALAQAVGDEHLIEGGGTSIIGALGASLGENPAFGQDDPFGRTDADAWREADLPVILATHLDLQRQQLTFRGVLDAQVAKVRALDIESDDWAAAYSAAYAAALDAWLPYRAEVAGRYALYIEGLDRPARQRLILRGDMRAPLQLPALNADSPHEGGTEISAPGPEREPRPREGLDPRENPETPDHRRPTNGAPPTPDGGATTPG